MSPWQKIVRAGKCGTGVTLTPSDVERLCGDDAICAVADHDDAADENAADARNRHDPESDMCGCSRCAARGDRGEFGRF